LQGPFITFEDTLLTVTGGAGLFREARGVCRLHNLSPLKLFYTFQLKGIPEIPRHLTAKVVEPSVDVKPIQEAANCEPGYVIPHYSD
jgi:allene oxide cyclase